MHANRIAPVEIPARDLEILAFRAAQYVRLVARLNPDNRDTMLGPDLGLALGYANVATYAQGDDDLPHSQESILGALSGVLTDSEESPA